MITHSTIYDFMRASGFRPKFAGFISGLNYTCVAEEWIPEFLKLTGKRLRKEGLLGLNPKEGTALCRHATLAASNHLAELARKAGKFARDLSPAVMLFSYTPDRAGWAEGHSILGFLVADGDSKLRIVWADILNGCKIIKLSETEHASCIHWTILL